MKLIDLWIARGQRRTDALQPDLRAEAEIFALSHAHGLVLALLGVILDRENVISSSDFARSLAGLATITATDQPDVGAILSRWASCVGDAGDAGYESGGLQ